MVKMFELVYSWPLRLNLIESWKTAFLNSKPQVIHELNWAQTQTYKGVLYIVSRPLVQQ